MSKRKPRKRLRELSRCDWFVLCKIAFCMVLVSPLWLIEAVMRLMSWALDKWNNCQFLIRAMDSLAAWAKR